MRLQLPFIFLKTHTAALDQLWANIRYFQVEMKNIQAENKVLQAENEALRSQLVDRSVIITPEKTTTRPKLIPINNNTRGGWRGRAQRASSTTFTPVNDSVAALEDKVKLEGGKINAV